jgi:hypothetical protein
MGMGTRTPQQRLRELVPSAENGVWQLCTSTSCAVPSVVRGDVPRMPVQLSVRGLAWASQPILVCGCCEGELFRTILVPEPLEREMRDAAV